MFRHIDYCLYLMPLLMLPDSDLMIDRSGCAWIAEDWLGMTRLRFSNVATDRIFLPKNGNPESNNIRAICPISDEDVLVSNNVGDVYRVSLTTKETRKIAHYEHRVYCMMLDNSSSLWTDTRGGGLRMIARATCGAPQKTDFCVRLQTMESRNA